MHVLNAGSIAWFDISICSHAMQFGVCKQCILSAKRFAVRVYQTINRAGRVWCVKPCNVCALWDGNKSTERATLHFFPVSQINYSVPWKLKYNFLCCLIGECLGLKLSWEILMFVIPRLSLKEDVLSIDSIESQLSMALTLPIRSPARPRTIPGQRCLHSTSPLSVPRREVVLNVTKALDWMRKMLNYNDL